MDTPKLSVSIYLRETTSENRNFQIISFSYGVILERILVVNGSKFLFLGEAYIKQKTRISKITVFSFFFLTTRVLLNSFSEFWINLGCLRKADAAVFCKHSEKIPWDWHPWKWESFILRQIKNIVLSKEKIVLKLAYHRSRRQQFHCEKTDWIYYWWLWREVWE